MARLIFLMAALTGLALADDTKVFGPVTNGTQGVAPKLMVFIPGGNVPTDNYVETVQAIQKRTELPLYVAIPSIPGKICIALTNIILNQLILSAIKQAEKAGWQGTHQDDVIIAGHSLGGTCANGYARAYGPFSSVVIFGSYVDETGPGNLMNYPTPVLTLGAELDGGLARPGKMAIWYKQFKNMTEHHVGDVLVNKPVLVLPRIDHSDFCPGFAVPGDLPSESSRSDALEAIGSTTAAFLHGQYLPASAAKDRAAARAVLEQRLLFTSELLDGYLRALELEVDSGMGCLEGGLTAPWCEHAQRLIANVADEYASKLQIYSTYWNSSKTLEHSRTKYSGGASGLTLMVHGHNAYYRDIANTGEFSAASEIGCKMLSGERVAQQLGVKNVGPKVMCKDVNEKAAAMAEKLLSNSSLMRFKAHGRILRFKPDWNTVAGPVWIKEVLELKTNASAMSVGSPSIHDSLSSVIFPGVDYCKLLSPARAMDWMMTDSLKAK